MAIVLGAIGAFAGVSVATNPNITIETLILRGTALAAFVLLHAILCIGPLARLDSRFLPLLYNRRHAGVVVFFLGLIHAIVVTIQYHAFSDTNPIVSIFTAYSMEYSALTRSVPDAVNVPFEPFGVAALVILFLMAATSHDFWLRNLGASFWKALHILVYIAYGLLVVHVAYGFLQSEQNLSYAIMLGGGMFAVFGLHIAAFLKETAVDVPTRAPHKEGFIPVCTVGDVKDGWGHAAFLRYDRVAVYRVGDRVFALSNICRHQGGPIGEGRLVDGFVTCPWHGWNYRVDTGVSPPPFHEVLPTFPVWIDDDTVYVHPEPYPLEAQNTGAPIAGGRSELVNHPVDPEA